ncbi:hypothetical protein E2542_SST00261 [Spatholobus suberectus]|nr:hypothetical protein E2542_SST00261 [Spatholobus suberectus]
MTITREAEANGVLRYRHSCADLHRGDDRGGFWEVVHASLCYGGAKISKALCEGPDATLRPDKDTRNDGQCCDLDLPYAGGEACQGIAGNVGADSRRGGDLQMKEKDAYEILCDMNVANVRDEWYNIKERKDVSMRNA